jgi:multiple sugar transport system permease protein
VIYTFSYVPLDLLVGLLFALLLNRRRPAQRVFLTIVYLPSVLAGVAYVVMWMWMLNPDAGLVNTVLSYVGIRGPRWLQDPQWALPSLVMMSLWGVGRSTIIFLAGLQGIPPELHEAAAMDAAGRLRRLFHVTLPLLTPAVLFNLLFGIIMTFQSFTNVFVATDGGPLDSTLFYVLYLYRNGFQYLRMGYASALAWVLLLIVMVVTLLIFNTSSRWVFYQGRSD